MICCVTGHRPKGFPFPRNESCDAYIQYLERLDRQVGCLIRNGYTHFVTGMAEGADRDFARCVLRQKKIFPYITLEAALPYPIHPRVQVSPSAAERASILSVCDQIVAVSPCYHNGCMQKRNVFMVDKSDLILAIWSGIEKGGTWNTIRYARQKNKAVQYIMLNK